MAKDLIIEIAAGNCDSVTIQALRVAYGSSVAAALDQAAFKNWHAFSIGIFGHRVTPEALLTTDCRIEIYQPLSIDPKQARLARVRGQKTEDRNFELSPISGVSQVFN